MNAKEIADLDPTHPLRQAEALEAEADRAVVEATPPASGPAHETAIVLRKAAFTLRWMHDGISAIVDAERAYDELKSALAEEGL